MQLPSSLSDLLTVAAALVGVYIVFALIASWINERIASWFQLRSTHLLAGIEQLVGDEASTGILSSPFISSLVSSQSDIGSLITRSVMPPGASLATGPSPKRPPAYLSATQFSSAVIDWIRRRRAQAHADLRASILGPQGAILPPGLASTLRRFAAANTDDEALATAVAALAQPAGLTSDQQSTFDTFSNLAKGVDDGFTRSLGAAATTAQAQLAALLDSLPAGTLRDQLLSIFLATEGDIETFVTGIENWFDDAMDRVSGWYQRSNQTILLAISLVLVSAFDLDTISIFRQLTSDPLLAARGAVFSGILQDASRSGTSFTITQGKITQPCPGGATAGAACSDCPSGFNAANSTCVLDTSFLSELPLGWGRDPLRLGSTDPSLFFYKICGLLLSMIAVAQGAPFWFNALASITSVRSSGPKPAKTPPAASGDST